ncbi:hypothetical protein EVAR_32324_1 [Eumeta japonica]|uniref:Uncharacterized protein n=1 Tax=Eumeta variegata TaxID=151549 RepID=A0A4C1ZA26_EUMVA|nr:hypothetical protein EVAR_32324_1 [Eumeta japonica]
MDEKRSVYTQQLILGAKTNIKSNIFTSCEVPQLVYYDRAIATTLSNLGTRKLSENTAVRGDTRNSGHRLVVSSVGAVVSSRSEIERRMPHPRASPGLDSIHGVCMQICQYTTHHSSVLRSRLRSSRMKCSIPDEPQKSSIIFRFGVRKAYENKDGGLTYQCVIFIVGWAVAVALGHAARYTTGRQIEPLDVDRALSRSSDHRKGQTPDICDTRPTDGAGLCGGTADATCGGGRVPFNILHETITKEHCHFDRTARWRSRAADTVAQSGARALGGHRRERPGRCDITFGARTPVALSRDVAVEALRPGAAGTARVLADRCPRDNVIVHQKYFYSGAASANITRPRGASCRRARCNRRPRPLEPAGCAPSPETDRRRWERSGTVSGRRPPSSQSHLVGRLYRRAALPPRHPPATSLSRPLDIIALPY